MTCDTGLSVTKGVETTGRPGMTIAFLSRILRSDDQWTSGCPCAGAEYRLKVIVAIGVHPGKKPLFSFEERAELITRSLADALPHKAGDISVVAFDNLVVDAARKHARERLLVRGLRDGTDLDYEMQMAGMNRQMAPDIQTLFLPAGTRIAAHNRHIGAADRIHGRRCQRLRAVSGS